MVLELVFGFLVLVAASYLGTTMALRGFFGRERYSPPVESGGGGPPDGDDRPGADDVPKASNVADDSEGE